MKGYDSEQVMSGTWGEIWIDDTYMAEVKKFRAEINASYEDVKRSRHLMIGKKLVSLSGEGEVTLNKTTSALMYKISEALKNGKSPSFKIIGKLDDPNAIGGERIVLYSCKFEKATLADWETGGIGEESYSFTFEDWDILDAAIPAQ